MCHRNLKTFTSKLQHVQKWELMHTRPSQRFNNWFQSLNKRENEKWHTQDFCKSSATMSQTRQYIILCKEMAETATDWKRMGLGYDCTNLYITEKCSVNALHMPQITVQCSVHYTYHTTHRYVQSIHSVQDSVPSNDSESLLNNIFNNAHPQNARTWWDSEA